MDDNLDPNLYPSAQTQDSSVQTDSTTQPQVFSYDVAQQATVNPVDQPNPNSPLAAG